MRDVWERNIPASVRRGDPMPPLCSGKNGYACRCGVPALYEWSPGHHRACSAACLQNQAPGTDIIAAVQKRHGVKLLTIKPGT